MSDHSRDMITAVYCIQIRIGSNLKRRKCLPGDATADQLKEHGVVASLVEAPHPVSQPASRAGLSRAAGLTMCDLTVMS
jgi:hypothetical protein